MKISFAVNTIKLVYCPGHKGIPDNEAADKLAKIASKKAKHLLHNNVNVSAGEIKQANKDLTVKKWSMRWENSRYIKYKDIVPTITKENIKTRKKHLVCTTRKGASKVMRLKSEHSMLYGHKSKIDLETKPECSTCKVKETTSHYLLHCKNYEKEREEMFKKIRDIFHKSKSSKFIITDLPSPTVLP